MFSVIAVFDCVIRVFDYVIINNNNIIVSIYIYYVYNMVQSDQNFTSRECYLRIINLYNVKFWSLCIHYYVDQNFINHKIIRISAAFLLYYYNLMPSYTIYILYTRIHIFGARQFIIYHVYYYFPFQKFIRSCYPSRMMHDFGVYNI